MSIVLIIAALFTPLIIGAMPQGERKALMILSYLCALPVIVVLVAVRITGSTGVGYSGVWQPYLIGGCVYGVALLAIWRPYKLKKRIIFALSLVALAASSIVIMNLVYDYRDGVPELRDDALLVERYEPFAVDTLAKSLTEPSTLTLTGDLPRIDGATALYPLYASFVRATYPPERTDNSVITCSRTAEAFYGLIYGENDVVFLMGVSDEQRRAAVSTGAELRLTPIGREAFVFMVNSRNPVSDISAENIRRIYSGEYASWASVGGGDAGIYAYQREEGSGSQTMLREIMGETKLMDPRTIDRYNAMMPMYRAVASYKNFKNALGYTFMFYVNDMIGEGGVKLLSIDGVAPNAANIASGAYPFVNQLYAVTATFGGEPMSPERAENTSALLEWILSPQGQDLVKATGYVPLGT
jgi:phosphate transport system substrate-binding protein